MSEEFLKVLGRVYLAVIGLSVCFTFGVKLIGG